MSLSLTLKKYKKDIIFLLVLTLVILPAFVATVVFSAAGSFSPGSLSFGNVVVGNDKSMPVSFTNTSPDPISYSVSAGSGFSCVGGCSFINVSPADSRLTTLRFSPGSTGAYSANGNFSSGAGDSVACSATDSSPDIDCVGSWSSFGSCTPKNPYWEFAACHGGCGWCTADVKYQTYSITTPKSGDGADCPYSDGAKGPDVYCEGTGHCSSFIAGTHIILEDGSVKNIELIEVGDKLQGSKGINVVLELKFHPHKGLVYSINEGSHFVTPGHPFMTREGWKAFDEKLAVLINPTLDIGKLEVGDMLVTHGGEVELKQFSFVEMSVPVYNFEVSGTRDYYADGYLVHNK